MALYRKFRPTSFEDVKGQEHIVTTLQNQVKANRIGHAYLFCGTRGTGKTTVAKIFAKAVNCLHPVDGSPCGECEMCRAIGDGSSMNVIEIDAASNNGVDNIREIREEVMYRPTEGRYKVYIIDEVHMLSTGAFNALLKTLEEPPEYVIFILATTEVHKIPITILSRCQHYDFRRITIDTIADRLFDLMRIEQVEVEERAIRYVAKAADGSMRDALSLLDQCIAFYLGQKLTYDHVLEVLGAVDTDVFSQLMRAILANDIPKVLDVVEELVMMGRELTQFSVDFTWYLRNLLLVKTSDKIEQVLDVSTENLMQLQEEAKAISMETILRYIRIFSDLSAQLKYATQKRVLLEAALMKICVPAMEVDLDSVLERVRVLEDKLEKGVVAVASTAGTSPVQVQASSEQKARPKVALPAAVPDDLKQVVKNFASIKGEASGIIRPLIANSRLSMSADNKLLLVCKDSMDASIMNKDEHLQVFQALIEKRIGKQVQVEVRHVEDGRRFEDTFADIEQKIHMDIIVED
jgi:DNA polymerase-3 subunit gamma/tau